GARVERGSSDEFGTLADGFNDMAEQIQAMYRNLEAKVTSKTAELQEKRERLEALRVQRLRALLTHAAAHVPYYRDLFARIGFDPAAVSSLTDLQRLPFLDKPLIRAHTDALKADDARGLARFNTGGSSGVPLIFYIGLERVSRDVAAKWR
ncbi:hypothetical protein NK983_24240, partial [Salmonella enterica subsp. enterica serovar Typhimurium]|nr:hypothetical protein [Salmonella enterica subsp. enterica serovar Typhimurium]